MNEREPEHPPDHADELDHPAASRNDAITEAESYQAQAAKLLLDAAHAQSQATDALRRGLSAQDNALGRFLVPVPPHDDIQLRTPGFPAWSPLVPLHCRIEPFLDQAAPRSGAGPAWQGDSSR
jgi:hypothetical protein